jgi:zinc transporter ZupT
VQYLRFFNFIAIASLIAVVCIQGYALGYYLFEKSVQNRNEALFGIAMLAMLSLWVVIPSLFTAVKLVHAYKLQSKILLLLCFLQGVTIIWALII